MTKRTAKNEKDKKEREEREAKKSKTEVDVPFEDGTTVQIKKRAIIPTATDKPPIKSKLNLPQKKKRVINTEEKMEGFEKLDEILKEAKNDVPEEDKFECPHCFEVLRKPFPPEVDSLIRRMNKREKKHRNEQIQQHKAELKMLKKEKKAESGFEKPLFIQKLGISEEAAKKFCQIHRIEIDMRPLGEKKSYPMKIRFDWLPGRVKRMQGELLDIVNGKTESVFFNEIKEVYKAEGSNKARSTFSLMRRVDKALPGYYGPRGSTVLVEVLGDLFMDGTIFKKEQIEPLKPVEYIQQVLVPECAVRLIQEDFKAKKLPCTREDALQIMKDSIEFGNVVHPEKQE